MADLLRSGAAFVAGGLAYGAILFLVAVGLVLSRRLTGVMNLAQAGFALTGAAIAGAVMRGLGLGYPVALGLAILGTMALATVLHLAVVMPLRNRPPLEQLGGMTALTLVTGAAAALVFGRGPYDLPGPAEFSGMVFDTVPYQHIALTAVAVIVLAMLHLGVRATRYGIAFRAMAENPRIAAALGLDPMRIYLAVFAGGAGLAALGGVLGAGVMTVDAGFAVDLLPPLVILAAIWPEAGPVRIFAAAMGYGLAESALQRTLPETGTEAGLMALALLAVAAGGLISRERAGAA